MKTGNSNLERVGMKLHLLGLPSNLHVSVVVFYYRETIYIQIGQEWVSPSCDHYLVGAFGRIIPYPMLIICHWIYYVFARRKVCVDS